MATKTFEILDSSEIQSFSIKVTEEISEKYLLEFLRTSIVNQQFNITKKSKFYYKFISSSLSYEVILFDENTPNNIPEPFVFFSLCDSKSKELFITQYYFSLFDSKQLILYKMIDNILKEDIQTYVEQLYKIKIDKVTVLDEKRVDYIKNDFQENYIKEKFEFYSLKKENSFYLFSIFFILIMSIFVFFVYLSQNKNHININTNENIISYEKGYTKLLKLHKKSQKEPIRKIVKLSNYFTENNISINKLSYKNNKLYLLLENSSRKELFQAIENYSNTIMMQSIRFDKNRNTYIMDIVINVKK